MTHLFVALLFACIWQGRLHYIPSNMLQVVLFRREKPPVSSSLPQYVSFDNIKVNFTVVEGQEKSYQQMLDKFCKIVQNTGVSVIISQDVSSHPVFIDIYASYMHIPVIKLFHSFYQKLVIKQEQSTVLHLEPDPNSRLVVITAILKKYDRNKRVVVVSDDKQSPRVSKLVAMLRDDSPSLNDVVLILTITKRDPKYYKIFSIILALNIKAVVVSLEQNVALEFLKASQQFGFKDIDCIWILEHSLDGHGKKAIPLLGKLLGVRLFQYQFSRNKSLSRQDALLKDSFKILKMFKNVSNREISVSSLLEDCNSSSYTSLGTSLYRAMKLVQTRGNTGWIEFNDQGYRTNVEYDIDYWYQDESGSTIKMLLARYHKNKLIVYYTGWLPERKLDILETKLAKNIPLRISVLLQEPYVVIKKNFIQNDSDDTCALGWPCVGLDQKSSCCMGYCIDLLKFLMKDIGFSVIIQVVKDGKYGALNHTTQQWSGLIGEVARGEADIAIADLTINEQRSKVIDFTHPYLDAGMGVIVKVAHRDKNNWTGFMDPFAITLWIALVICVNIALVIMWLLERCSPYGQWGRAKVLKENKEYSFGLVQTIWFTWSLVFQTFDVGTKPKSFSCRILALAFAFSMLIVITSYTANLAAFLVVEEEILPLSDAGIRDLKLQNPPSGFRIATIKDSSFERFFQATDDARLRRVWQHMKPHSVKNFTEAIEQMNTGKLQAFVSDNPTLENFAAKSPECSFKIVGKMFFQSGFGLAVRKNSSLTLRISRLLLQYEEYDISRTLRYRWFLGQCSSMNHDENAMFAQLSVTDLSGLFLAICLGVIISTVFFILECVKISFTKSSSYGFRRR